MKVEEREQMDRCMDQTSSTSAIVAKAPPAEVLHQDIACCPDRDKQCQANTLMERIGLWHECVTGIL